MVNLMQRRIAIAAGVASVALLLYGCSSAKSIPSASSDPVAAAVTVNGFSVGVDASAPEVGRHQGPVLHNLERHAGVGDDHQAVVDDVAVVLDDRAVVEELRGRVVDVERRLERDDVVG